MNHNKIMLHVETAEPRIEDIISAIIKAFRTKWYSLICVKCLTSSR
jgi:hypothetical protein